MKKLSVIISLIIVTLVFIEGYNSPEIELTSSSFEAVVTSLNGNKKTSYLKRWKDLGDKAINV